MVISVIVPVYNVELILPKCLESILKYNENIIEVILVNDGSTDRSGDICEQFQFKDSRVRVFHTENRGVSSARNLGILNANGDYLAFVDSDDFISDDYFPVLFEALNVNCADIIQFGYNRISLDGDFVIKPSKTRVYSNLGKYLKNEIYLHFVWAYLFKKDLILKNELFFPQNICYSEDQEFLGQCFILSGSIVVLPYSLYNYVYREGSAVSNISKQHIKSFSNLLVASNLVPFASSGSNQLFVYFLIYNLILDYYSSYRVYRPFNLNEALKELSVLRSNSFSSFFYFIFYIPINFPRISLFVCPILIFLRKIFQGIKRIVYY